MGAFIPRSKIRIHWQIFYKNGIFPAGCSDPAYEGRPDRKVCHFHVRSWVGGYTCLVRPLVRSVWKRVVDSCSTRQSFAIRGRMNVLGDNNRESFEGYKNTGAFMYTTLPLTLTLSSRVPWLVGRTEHFVQIWCRWARGEGYSCLEYTGQVVLCERKKIIPPSSGGVVYPWLFSPRRKTTSELGQIKSKPFMSAWGVFSSF